MNEGGEKLEVVEVIVFMPFKQSIFSKKAIAAFFLASFFDEPLP